MKFNEKPETNQRKIELERSNEIQKNKHHRKIVEKSPE